MPSVSFTAPTTVDEAVKALAGAAGLAKVLSGGTDLLVQLRSGRLKPELIVDTKRIPGPDRHPRGGRRFRDRRRDAGGHDLASTKRLTHAWPGIVEGVDLIGSTADPGARLARRQSVQRLAGGRQRAGADRRACDCGHRRARAAGARRRSRPSSPGPGRPRSQKGEFIVEFHVPKPKPRQSRRLSALHPAHRDGHRRRRLRRQRDARRGRRLHRCAGRARRRGADPAHRRRGGAGADRPQARRRHACRRSTPRRSAPASRSPTSAARSNTAPRSPASSRAARPRSPLNAPPRA